MGWGFHTVLASVQSVTVGFLGLVVASRAGFAYPTPVDFSGKLERWNIELGAAPITYEIQGDEADLGDLSDLIDQAAAQWTAVPTSYVELAPVSEGEIADVSIKVKSTIDGASYSAGFAIFDKSDAKGPMHCTIEIVADAWMSYHAFAKTALHELGHCLGLGHSLVPEAIMSYSLEKNSFELDTDDVAGVSRLYPADGSKPKLPPGCAVGVALEGRSVASLWVLLLSPLAFVLCIARCEPGALMNRK